MHWTFLAACLGSLVPSIKSNPGPAGSQTNQIIKIIKSNSNFKKFIYLRSTLLIFWYPKLAQASAINRDPKLNPNP